MHTEAWRRRQLAERYCALERDRRSRTRVERALFGDDHAVFIVLLGVAIILGVELAASLQRGNGPLFALHVVVVGFLELALIAFLCRVLARQIAFRFRNWQAERRIDALSSWGNDTASPALVTRGTACPEPAGTQDRCRQPPGLELVDPAPLPLRTGSR